MPFDPLSAEDLRAALASPHEPTRAWAVSRASYLPDPELHRVAAPVAASLDADEHLWPTGDFAEILTPELAEIGLESVDRTRPGVLLRNALCDVSDHRSPRGRELAREVYELAGRHPADWAGNVGEVCIGHARTALLHTEMTADEKMMLGAHVSSYELARAWAFQGVPVLRANFDEVLDSDAALQLLEAIAAQVDTQFEPLAPPLELHFWLRHDLEAAAQDAWAAGPEAFLGWWQQHVECPVDPTRAWEGQETWCFGRSAFRVSQALIERAAERGSWPEDPALTAQMAQLIAFTASIVSDTHYIAVLTSLLLEEDEDTVAQVVEETWISVNELLAIVDAHPDRPMPVLENKISASYRALRELVAARPHLLRPYARRLTRHVLDPYADELARNGLAGLGLEGLETAVAARDPIPATVLAQIASACRHPDASRVLLTALPTRPANDWIDAIVSVLRPSDFELAFTLAHARDRTWGAAFLAAIDAIHGTDLADRPAPSVPQGFRPGRAASRMQAKRARQQRRKR